MRNIYRTFSTVLAALALAFTGIAVAQEGDPIAACEATGGLWVENYEGVEGLDICDPYGHQKVECAAGGGEWHNDFWGQYCSLDGHPYDGSPLPEGTGSSAEPTAEPAPAEPAPSAPLPATETAPAQQGAPQYTG
jgi:hypothetical protein